MITFSAIKRPTLQGFKWSLLATTTEGDSPESQTFAMQTGNDRSVIVKSAIKAAGAIEGAGLYLEEVMDVEKKEMESQGIPVLSDIPSGAQTFYDLAAVSFRSGLK